MPFAPTLTEQPTAAEVRAQLQAAGDYLGDLIRTPEDQRGDTHADDVRSAVNAINELDPTLTALERSVAPEPRGPDVAFIDTGPGRVISAGEDFTRQAGSNGQTFEEFQRSGQAGATFFEAEIRGTLREQRTLLDSGTTTLTVTNTGAWLPMGQPIAPRVRQQRLFLRDVIPVIQTGLHAIPYIQELNPATTETGATAVAEGIAKPEVTMTFQQLVAVLTKIAAWVPATEEIISDAPTLQGYINTRLAYMVDLREEAEALKGGGNSPNMKGIRDFTVQTQTVVANDFPGTIGLAIGKIENVDGEATFVAANPLNFWVAATTRHANAFDNGYTPGAPAVLAGLTWGTAALRTRSMESGKALVGAAMGATLAEREGTTIRVGNQHSTFFTENKVAILAEKRSTILVHRPDMFVECDVPTS